MSLISEEKKPPRDPPHFSLFDYTFSFSSLATLAQQLLVFCKTGGRFTVFWDAARQYMNLFCIASCSIHRSLRSTPVTERRAVHVSISPSKSFLCISAELVIDTALFGPATEFLLLLTKSKPVLPSPNWHRSLKVHQLSPSLLLTRAAFLQILRYQIKHTSLHWFSYPCNEPCDGNLVWLV